MRIFSPVKHMLSGNTLKGEGNMDNHEEPERDVDDLIFEGEEWAPSGR